MERERERERKEEEERLRSPFTSTILIPSFPRTHRPSCFPLQRTSPPRPLPPLHFRPHTTIQSWLAEEDEEEIVFEMGKRRVRLSHLHELCPPFWLRIPHLPTPLTHSIHPNPLLESILSRSLFPSSRVPWNVVNIEFRSRFDPVHPHPHPPSPIHPRVGLGWIDFHSNPV